MPQVTVYIRNEDLDKWKLLEKKSEFIHQALNNLETKVKTVDMTEADYRRANEFPQNIKENPDGTVSIADPTKPARLGIKTAQTMNPPGIQLCKIHRTPLDDRGRCMIKGCKYN